MGNERKQLSKEELVQKIKLLRAYNLISIFAAGSGHSGGTLSMAEFSAILYWEHARLDPKNPNWPDRDRIFYSTGHKAPIQYCAMAMAGYFPIDDTMTLRQFESPFQGHPHSLKCPGIEISAGSLGQGLGISVGDALSARLDKKDYRIYCIMGDGEQQEGSVWEAVMAAAHYKLDNLCGIIDINRLQIDGYVEDVLNIEPIGEKYAAFGWNVIQCNGHDVDDVRRALKEAGKCKGKPSVILADTVKGKGVSFMEDIAGWHGIAPTSREQLDQALGDILGDEVFSKEEVDRLIGIADEWMEKKRDEINSSVPDWDESWWWNSGKDMQVKMKPTRVGFGEALEAIGDDQRIVTLQVDISGSIKISQFEMGHPERKERVFSIGIAEQNMIQVAAGLAKNGKIPVVGSYGVFASGRCWDQIRTSVCYPNMNVKIAGAHAGVSVGPDGATHQALEEISLMAIIPHMNLVIPADSVETDKATRNGVLEIEGPLYLRFAREATPVISDENTPFVFGKANVIRYRGRQQDFVKAFETVLAEEYKDEKEDVCVIACGPMVPEAMRAAYILKEKHDLETRIINMHTLKPLDEEAIRKAVEDIGVIVTAEEHQKGGFGNIIAGAAVRNKARELPLTLEMVGVNDRFGESGKPWDLMKAFELCAEHIVARALSLKQ